MASSQMSEAKRFGGNLFGAVFQDRVRDVYHGALSQAEQEGRGLRITLYLTEVPELMHVPWEYLYDDPGFLAISAWTPVVRYLDLPRARRPLEVEPPIRVLGMVSSPTDAVALDVKAEKERLETALSKLIEAGTIELHWLEDASLRALLRTLRHETFHIFHYIGHGLYDTKAEDGVLLLEGEDERGRPVSGSELGTILHDCTSLRLAVLNACEGARTAGSDPFAGVAASLVQREIPAVIAMQFEITDDAALVFAEGFYEAVAAGFPVDAALAEARKAIFADHNDTEWGTPVLFMRVADGRIFDMSAPPPPLPAPRLELALSADPPDCRAGEPVTWRLSAHNEGGSPLSDVTVLDGEGTTVAGPFDLPGNARHTVTWSSRPESDLDQTVTVGGRSPSGTVVSAQATAHVSVRPARPPPPTVPAKLGLPPDPARREPSIGRARPLEVERDEGQVPTVESPPPILVREHPAEPARPGPGALLGDLIAALSAIALILSLGMDWRPGTSGWDSASHPALLAVLALAVVALAAAHASGRPRGHTPWIALTIALGGLAIEDRLVLESLGNLDGRILAIVAAGGIVVGGALALAADKGGDPTWARVSAGEVVATLGGVLIFASLWLPWIEESPSSGWERFALTDAAFATLAAALLLIALARAFVPGVDLRPGGGLVLLLIGVVLAERVVSLRNLIDQKPAPDFMWDSTGRFVALAGALLIVLGGLMAISTALRARASAPGSSP
jgi:drug/metabolite transporter superfamily protein YnfA